jgi:predicted nucleic acid-binding protein
MPREFVDTNVIVYAFSTDLRTGMASSILKRGCQTSIQGLNEFVSVARRKLGMDWSEVDRALRAIGILCRQIHPVDNDTHRQAVTLARNHNFHIYDALMLASALKSGCDTFYSEDLQHGLKIERQLQIVNPFQ